MKGDLNKDGKMSGYEKTRQSAIDKNMKKEREKFYLGTGKRVPEGTEHMYPRLKRAANDMTVIANDIMYNLTRSAGNLGSGAFYDIAEDYELTPEETKELASFRETIRETSRNLPETRGLHMEEMTTGKQRPKLGLLGKLYFGYQNRKAKQEGGPMSMDDQMVMAMGITEKPEMESDVKMEDNYTNFIIEEALTEKEEDMLTSKLEQDKELQMLFDKVIDVAQEFAGSGPVDGPGSGVSDSIPARLSDGEFVITAKATEQIGADKLMSMMRDAEDAADMKQRQELNMGGPSMFEEELPDDTSDIVSDMRKVNPRFSSNER